MTVWKGHEVKEAPKSDTTVPGEREPYMDFTNLVPIHLGFLVVDPAFLGCLLREISPRIEEVCLF